MYGILLPDVQANRDFARDLQIRVTYRLGLGDTEGAWYDVMSMLTLARKHYKNDPILVVNLVGAAIERLGYSSAKVLLKQGNLTQEQLTRFAKELDALPSSHSSFDSVLGEQYMLFDALQRFNQNRKELYELFELDENIIEMFGDEPIDPEITKKHILQLLEECKSKQVSFEEIFANRLLRRQYFENIDKKAAEIKTALEKQAQTQSNLSHEELSQLTANVFFAFFMPNWLLGVAKMHDHCDSELVLLRIAFALERYKRDHGDYPETLEALLFTYLEEVPLDPSTSRSTMTYKKDGDDERFLLYSYGPNQQDDGGQEAPGTLDGDIVF